MKILVAQKYPAGEFPAYDAKSKQVSLMLDDGSQIVIRLMDVLAAFEIE